MGLNLRLDKSVGPGLWRYSLSVQNFTDWNSQDDTGKLGVRKFFSKNLAADTLSSSFNEAIERNAIDLEELSRQKTLKDEYTKMLQDGLDGIFSKSYSSRYSSNSLSANNEQGSSKASLQRRKESYLRFSNKFNQGYET